jgi:unsaturated rhamnogalacturonyl hydrolase
MKTRLVIFFMFGAGLLFPRERTRTETVVRAIADGILSGSTWRFIHSTDQKLYRRAEELPGKEGIEIQSPYNTWHYWNGVLNLGMLELADALGEKKYEDFALKNMRFAFDNSPWFEKRRGEEDKWHYPFAMLFIMDELDCCGAEGASLIEVYRREKRDDYRAYIDRAAGYVLRSQSRLGDGTLARPFPRQMTLWADDLYMSVPLLARYGELTQDGSVFDFAAKQVIQFRNHLVDPHAGLYYHCWFSDLEENGVAHWGRCNGWVMMAQVDLLDRLPPDHPDRPALLKILREQVIGVSRRQSESGLWHQVLDRTDSYLETSCTAMFTWSISHAIRKGYIDPGYFSVAEGVGVGLLTKIDGEGGVDGICVGTGIENDMVFYYRRPTQRNDIHGLGAVLLSGIEMLRHEGEQRK